MITFKTIRCPWYLSFPFPFIFLIFFWMYISLFFFFFFLSPFCSMIQYRSHSPSTILSIIGVFLCLLHPQPPTSPSHHLRSHIPNVISTMCRALTQNTIACHASPHLGAQIHTADIKLQCSATAATRVNSRADGRSGAQSTSCLAPARRVGI